jgi:alpha-mannosidase
MAKFEVVAHKYVDLSDNGYGVALLNDCKYGFKVLDSVIDMNVLRAPTYPDPTADIREHRFAYSLLPHTGTLIESEVMAHAQMLNHPPVVAENRTGASFRAPCSVTGQGVSLEVVKKSEKEDCRVIRIVETDGRQSTATLCMADRSAKLVPTNLMEWEDGAVIDCAEPITIKLNPFEIATYKICGASGG